MGRARRPGKGFPGRLSVFRPGKKETAERVASWEVAEEKTYAYPVISGTRIAIQDGDSVTLCTLE